MNSDAFAAAIARDGWATTSPIISSAELQDLRAATAPMLETGRGGARNLLELPSVRALATSETIRSLATGVLGPCFVARGLLFDKTPDSNWKVIWHQDLTIATKAKVEVPGFGPWTEKDGVPHVQPPVAILETMLAVRVHLDPCHAANGPVRVISGSHTSGRLSPAAIDAFKSQESVECLAEEGGVLAFRPLILHASSPSVTPAHRRVIHLEFAAAELPPPLEWRWRLE